MTTGSLPTAFQPRGDRHTHLSGRWSRQPSRWDREAGTQHEVDVERGRVAQSPDRCDLAAGCLSERDAAALTGRRTGPVDERRRPLLPPVVGGVGQPSTGLKERVRIHSPSDVDPTGAHPVVETEDVEVRLEGQVQR